MADQLKPQGQTDVATSSATKKGPVRKVETKRPSESADIASSPDKVVDMIHRGILAGRYVPGQKLIEADLTQALGVSRGPVREALKRLDAEGVVELTRHRGAYIRSLTRTETLDLLEILDMFTDLIARRAAASVAAGETNTPSQHEALGWLERFQKLGMESEAFLDHRRHFYDALIALGGNSQLHSVMPMMRIQLVRLQVQPYFSSEERQDRLDEYLAISKAVLNGDGTAARKAMRHHMKRMNQRISRLPTEAFARG